MGGLTRARRVDYADTLAAERAELLRFLEGLAPDDWDAKTECPAWSVKGIALHLLGDDLSILSRQRDREPSPVLIDVGSDWDELFVVLDRHNEQWVTASSFLSLPLLVELLRRSGEETHLWYSTVDSDLLGEPIPWIGPDPAPYWLLCAREYFERWIHHCQIRRSVGHGRWCEERWVHPAVAVAVRGFASGLAVLPATEGSTVTIAIDDGPDWTVRKDDERWDLFDGAVAEPTLALSLDTGTAALLFSRGLEKSEVHERIRLSGDNQLAQMFALGLAAFFGR
jgi:uncharacterized protein (TIGR03083 family)